MKPETPNEALSILIQGNERSASDQMLHPNRTIERREAIASQQNPFAIIVGCSDSRVPPEIIFDQGLGDLFIVRVAGHVVGRVELDSMEFAVKYLGASLIFVLGHENCGAVTNVLNGNTTEIEAIADLMKPAFEDMGELTVEEAVKCHVNYTVNYILGTDYLGNKALLGDLKIVGGYYNLSSGRVSLLQS
jgi:carbonic anhydrase